MDHASRSVSALLLAKALWFTGPHFLMNTPNKSEQIQPFDLVELELDTNVHPSVRSYATELEEEGHSVLNTHYKVSYFLQAYGQV